MKIFACSLSALLALSTSAAAQVVVRPVHPGPLPPHVYVHHPSRSHPYRHHPRYPMTQPLGHHPLMHPHVFVHHGPFTTHHS